MNNYIVYILTPHKLKSKNWINKKEFPAFLNDSFGPRLEDVVKLLSTTIL